MRIEIDNITFNFTYSGHGAVDDDSNLGISDLFIPGPMSERFRREMGSMGDEGFYLFPHYDEYSTKDNMGLSEHRCYNSDTQIVLMSWLFEKKRKYVLNFEGLDPFWIYHDSFHAKNDVYGSRVDGIDSHVEYERLLEGAEFAFSKGVSIAPETLAKLDAEWARRWKTWERDNYRTFRSGDFARFMDEEDYEVADMLISIGKYGQDNRWSF